MSGFIIAKSDSDDNDDDVDDCGYDDANSESRVDFWLCELN